MANKPRRKRRLPGEGLRLERRNYYILGAGIVSIILGYILLGAGSITAAPIFLVLGYCFLVPFSLFWRPRNPGEEFPVRAAESGRIAQR